MCGLTLELRVDWSSTSFLATLDIECRNIDE